MSERGRTRVVVLSVIGLLAVAGLAVAAVLVLRSDDVEAAPSADEAGARRAAEAFATAVSGGLPGGGGTVEPAADVDAEFLVAVEGLGPLDLDVTVGEVTAAGAAGTADLETTWSTTGLSWTTSGTLGLVRLDSGGDGSWRSQWSLAALDSRLGPGDALDARRSTAPRGAILAAGGEPLTGGASQVVVGVQPSRTEDVAALVFALVDLLGIDGADLTARLGAAAPGDFVEVTRLTEEEYAPLRDQLQPLPGTVFRREEDGPAAPGVAGAVLGQVAPASEELAAASDGRIEVGQTAGAGGVQQAFDEQLAGAPGLEVRVTRAAPAPPDEPTSTTAAPDPEVAEVLESQAATPGRDVVTTLDLRTQVAAEAALGPESRLSTLVALRPSTGEVLAIANANNGGYDYGSRARVPPGSTFKVVTTLAHLRKGLTPDQVVPCPPTINVGGKEFKNAGDLALGDVAFRLDFARSCNTAFAGLADQLAPEDLNAAAANMGIGVEWSLGIPTFTGSVPPTEGVVDAAASSIGQARLVISPLAMAGVAATVAAGRWRAPTLVTDPASDAPEERPLAPGEPEILAALMRGVVTDGSGTALLGVPGDPVMAKTGTAEFGTDVPPQTHAWIIGFQGDVAFAVFVEGGEGGGSVAGPIAARFLTTLNGG